MGLLEDKATRLRIDCVRATTAAGSGHPTTCASAAEIVSVLFFSVMRYDPKKPDSPLNDKFVLSKGHAAPLLYSAWAEAGAFPREHLLSLRQIDSDLEGHPTPRLPFVDVATGSLGQGLSVGIGMALGAQLDRSDQRIYVLMGDGESAEGSVWEAAELGGVRKLSNLCAIIDVNRLGQSEPTMLQHHMETYRKRWDAFGWNAITVDGHSIPGLLDAFKAAEAEKERPTIILARTLKGKGMLEAEDKEGYHGKPFPKEAADKIVAALKGQLGQKDDEWKPNLPEGRRRVVEDAKPQPLPQPPYKPGGKETATRKAFGDALAALGKADERIVALDGDVKNSTHSEEFQKVAPDRFFQGYIAEQDMVGMAMGLSATGRIPFAATFGCFLQRAADFIRMAAISNNNIKLAGTHAGISIGEDGPSQMALEDLATICAEPNFTVLYPSDATSSWRATELAAGVTGPCYMRFGRPNSPVLYDPAERFAIGKCKVLRESARDRALVIAAGVTVFEALAAYDELKNAGVPVRVIDLFSVQPIDRETLLSAAQACNGVVITVEDHYAHGGIGDAVAAALGSERFLFKRLAVTEIPRSGKAKELLERFGISARHIVQAVQELAAPARRAGHD